MCDLIRFPTCPCRLNPSRPRLFSPLIPQSSSSTPNHHFHNLHSFSSKLQVTAFTALASNGPSHEPDSSLFRLSLDLSPICSESQFDQVVSEGPSVIMWTASWCRKCIYLKPKMEKLAAEYFPRVRFYCVDVNKVPHKLVARAAVTKMPTIQLWRDGKKQEEVVGGDKPHLIVNEVRELIDNDNEIS